MVKKEKQRFGSAFLVLGVMFVLIAAYIVGAYQMARPADDRICNGVKIETVDVSGMTEEEAHIAVDGFITGLAGRTLEVDVNGKKVTTSMDRIGFSCSSSEAIANALSLGKKGNIFTNYADLKKIAAEGTVYHLEYSYSEKKLKKFVSGTCNKKCTSAKNSKIKMRAGKLVYTEARQGITIDTDATVENIKKALAEQENEDIVKVAAIVTLEEPTVTKELASRCKDKIGAFSTEYNPGNVSRSKNVANAARLINGSVIYPGQTFSVHDAISPMTEKNGYYAAPSYSNGQVVDSIGGGVCQVSTTLYNAVLRAELEVIERSPHSMLVSYVRPSMDAAIAGDYKDFKFRNNTDVPIYIEGAADSGIIYFRIYGEETRSEDRTVTFESETLEIIQPGADKVTYDETKPASYVSVTQEAHQGCKAVLWKIVTQNGKTKKTQVNSSTYQAEPRYVTKGGSSGTGDGTEQTPAPSTQPGAGSDTATKAPAATKAPKVVSTPRPKVTKTPVVQKPKPKVTATPKPKVTKAPVAEVMKEPSEEE